MPVPSSPQLYRRVVTVELLSGHEKAAGLTSGPGHPPTRKYSSTSEAFLSTSGGERARKQSVTGSGAGGWHRSRERTRQSAVQRLVERKLAQREKEREKERDRSWVAGATSQHGSSGRSFSRERDKGRDRSGTRSENGFMLGHPSSLAKENIGSDSSVGGRRSARTSRSCSGSRYRDFDGTEEATAKTYITIGPGKPTRIREHSPSKSAKLSCEETVTTARERSAQSRNSSPFKARDQNRCASPSPQRKLSAAKADAIKICDEKNNEFLRTASPLKSTNIFKSFQSTETQSTRKLSFVTEKSILVSQCIPQSNKKANQKEKKERRLSIEILKTAFKVPDDDKLKRASVESTSSSNRSSVSSLSGSSDSGVETDRAPTNISQRRISLEQRFQARARISSPERSEHSFRQTFVKSENEHGSSEVFVQQRASNCRVSGDSRKRSSEASAGLSRPIPASRKISLPQPPVRRPEPAPRRRPSLQPIIASDR